MTLRSNELLFPYGRTWLVNAEGGGHSERVRYGEEMQSNTL